MPLKIRYTIKYFQILTHQDSIGLKIYESKYFSFWLLVFSVAGIVNIFVHLIIIFYSLFSTETNESLPFLGLILQPRSKFRDERDNA